MREEGKCLEASPACYAVDAGEGTVVTSCDVSCDSKQGVTSPSSTSLLLEDPHTFCWLDLNGKCPVSKQGCSVIQNNCFSQTQIIDLWLPSGREGLGDWISRFELLWIG